MRYLKLLGAALPLMMMAACEDDSLDSIRSWGLTAPVVASRGEVLARTSCAPCHGADFRGDQSGRTGAPDLRLVTGHSPEEFDRLLCTGAARAGDPINVDMVAVGLGQLPEGDRLALYRYLVSVVPDPTK